MKKPMTFQEQAHFMSRQAQMLAEEGNDVSSRVMMEAMTMLSTAHARHEALKNLVQEVLNCERLFDLITFKGAPAGTHKKRSRAMKAIRSIVRAA